MLTEYTHTLESENVIAWIMHHGILNERGAPISFDNHAFMIDPYLDWTPNQGSRKASQCGWSVMTNLKLFFAAKHGIPGFDVNAANVIYTLPSDEDVKAFVPSKTNLLISNNPVITGYIKDDFGNKKDVNSVQRKQINKSFVYFKGTRSQTAALMLTSDLNIHDESDRSVKEIVDQYESRLATSKYKGRWVFSNPSAPNMPADLMFQVSDQKYWFIKCQHCGHWQYLDWVKLSETPFTVANHCYIDDKNRVYVCGKCAAPITDDNRKRGRWVRKYASKKEISGYWVSHLMYPWITCAEMLRTEETKSRAYFLNFAMGLPYVGSDVVVDRSVIIQNIVLDQRRWVKGQVAMGVDCGVEKHYVIGDTEGIIEIGKTKSWADIEFLIAKYEPYTVIDLNPYPNKAKEIAKTRKGRIWCSFFVDNQQNPNIVEWGKVRDKKGFMVYPNRDKVIDDLIEYIFSGKLKFFRAESYWEEYIRHWESMFKANVLGSKKVETDSIADVEGLRQVRSTWLSSTGMDHYCFATVYYYLALSRLIGGGGKVLSDKGPVIQQVAKELGGIPVAPTITDQGAMKPRRPYIKDILALTKQKRSKNSSASGKM